MSVSFTQQKNPGIAALMVVVLIGSAALVMGLASSARGLNTLELSVLQSRTEQSRLRTESCVEEALLQLYRNTNWSGGTLSIDLISCTIAVSGDTTMKTLSVSIAEQKSVVLTVQREDGVWRIIRWNE